MSLVFAAIAPHPPILLPDVGSQEDRELVKNTIEKMDFLGKVLIEKKVQKISISSPHPDWGFNVPLHFLAKDFDGEVQGILTDFETPYDYFQKGKDFFEKEISKSKTKHAFIASGDLSHSLKESAPNGFHPDGQKFDEELVNLLKEKDIDGILKLDEKYPNAAQCGLGSICFLLGVLEKKGKYTPEILSYEAPFGVGYLVVNFKLDE